MNQSILILAAYGAPYEGNFIPSIRMLSRTLKEQNIDTVLILQKRVEKYDWAQKLDWCSEVLFISGSIASDVSKIAVLMKRHHFLFAHTHFAESKHIAMLKLAMLLSLQKFPIVEHHHIQYAYGGSELKRIIKAVLMHGDFLVGCGEAVGESLRNAKLLNDISYVDNAIDFSRLTTEKEHTHSNSILMFGHDFTRKGVDLALSACERLAVSFPELRLKICVAVGMDEMKKRLLELFTALPSWLELLEPTNHIQDYYTDAKVFISPSRIEGLCYSVIEAAYCGCAVIGSDIEGIREIQLADMKLVPKDDSHVLEQAIREIFQMPEEEFRVLTDSLHNQAVSYYRLNRWVGQMMDYYRKKELIP